MIEGDALYRRAAFLLGEAKHGEKRDQVITFTMRVLSNFATIGKDAGSSKIKDENTRVSAAALQLIGSVEKLGHWHKLTINEHPLPLKEIWHRILLGAADQSPFDVWSIFVANPMITITKEEDALISKSGLRSSSAPDRYERLGIETLILDSPPKELILGRLGSS